MSKERVIQKIKDNIIEVIYRHTGSAFTLLGDDINEAAERIFDYFDVPQESEREHQVFYRDIADLQRCFITQKQENEELLDKLGELSMKLNMMQSDLREFEKQKVEPIKAELYQVSQRVGDNFRIHETATDDLETDVMYLKERIDKLEKFYSDWRKKCLDGVFVHYTSNLADRDYDRSLDRLEVRKPDTRADRLICDKCDSVLSQGNTGDFY